MSAIDDLSSLDLSHLFSGPLIAAIDASVRAQRETLDLIREVGYDENGNLITVTFAYTTSEVDPETGEAGRVRKHLEIPLLLFLSFPELVVHQIEEEFSARITEVEKTERETEREGSPLLAPYRLNVAPSSESVTFSRRTRQAFDLDIRMVAELDSQSTGVEMLERAANNAIFERGAEEGSGGSAIERREAVESPRDREQ